MASWTIPPPLPNPNKGWKGRRSEEQQARQNVLREERNQKLRDEAADRGLLIKDLAPVNPKGSRITEAKTMQVGLRLSDAELALYVKVNEHLPVSFSAWVQYCVLCFIEQPDVAALRAWVPPSPQLHARNACLTPTSKRQVEALMAPSTAGMQRLHLATAVRFAMVRETPRYLALPSAAERAAEAEAQRLKLSLAQALKPRPSAPVLVPISETTFGAGTTDKANWIFQSKKKKEES